MHDAGKPITANDLLFAIDPRPYKADVDKARAALDMASARLRKAEGDHNVATEKCQTLQASLTQACKDQADAEYEAAKAAAKATRTARQQ